MSQTNSSASMMVTPTNGHTYSRWGPNSKDDVGNEQIHPSPQRQVQQPSSIVRNRYEFCTIQSREELTISEYSEDSGCIDESKSNYSEDGFQFKSRFDEDEDKFEGYDLQGITKSTKKSFQLLGAAKQSRLKQSIPRYDDSKRPYSKPNRFGPPPKVESSLEEPVPKRYGNPPKVLQNPASMSNQKKQNPVEPLKGYKQNTPSFQTSYPKTYVDNISNPPLPLKGYANHHNGKVESYNDEPYYSTTQKNRFSDIHTERFLAYQSTKYRPEYESQQPPEYCDQYKSSQNYQGSSQDEQPIKRYFRFHDPEKYRQIMVPNEEKKQTKETIQVAPKRGFHNSKLSKRPETGNVANPEEQSTSNRNHNLEGISESGSTKQTTKQKLNPNCQPYLPFAQSETQIDYHQNQLTLPSARFSTECQPKQRKYNHLIYVRQLNRSAQAFRIENS